MLRMCVCVCVSSLYMCVACLCVSTRVSVCMRVWLVPRGPVHFRSPVQTAFSRHTPQTSSITFSLHVCACLALVGPCHNSQCVSVCVYVRACVCNCVACSRKRNYLSTSCTESRCSPFVCVDLCNEIFLCDSYGCVRCGARNECVWFLLCFRLVHS